VRIRRRGAINLTLNHLVSSGVIAGFRTNYETREEPDRLRITVTRADGRQRCGSGGQSAKSSRSGRRARRDRC
jgi:hypothetical protein